MLVTVAAIELVILCHAAELSHPSIWDWREAGRAARQRAGASAILCFGDSQVKWGIQALVLERLTGQRVYNLAALAGQAPTSYFQLRRALASGPAPRSVLVNYAPFFLAHGPRVNLRRWPEMLDTRESWELACDAGDPGLFAAITLARLIPSLKQRDELRTLLTAALRGERNSSLYAINAFRRNFHRNHGSHAMDHDPHFQGQLRAQDVPFVRFLNWRCDPLNATYVEKFLSLAQQRGIRVFWLIPPMAPAAQALFEENGNDGRYIDFVRKTAARFPAVCIVDGRHSGYSYTVCCDALHLDHQGASVFTAEVASLIMRYPKDDPMPAAWRWVQLPPYRDRSPDPSVERLSDSLLAGAKRGGVRRQ